MTSEVMPYPAGADAADYTVLIGYDDLDRVTSRVVPPAGMDPSEPGLGLGMVMNGYDAGANGKGHLTSVSHPEGVMDFTYAYDGRGRRKRETFSFNLSALGEPQLSDARTVQYKYNALGNVVNTWYADTDGSSAATMTTVSYDDRGLPMTVANGGNVLATYQRNVAGKITSRTSPSSDRTFSYDSLGRVVWDYALDGSGGTQFLNWYHYYPTGDLQSLYSRRATTPASPTRRWASCTPRT